jgi:Zn-dependent protease
MTDQSYPLGPPLEYHFVPPASRAFFPRKRLWLHVLLLCLTLLTTVAVGAQFDLAFSRHEVALTSLNPFSVVWDHPGRLLNGLPFSLTLLAILLAHEMGHYLTCRRYGIDATLPYFIPAPTLIGTMGAFIRIRSPITSRRALFDVGVSGPLAGFVVTLPLLIGGVAASQVVAAPLHNDIIAFGNPPLVRILEWVLFPRVPADNICLHPVARAAWVGLFATALNLIPIGQLDGGHILYAFFGERHRKLSRLFILALLPLGYFYWLGWIIWAVLLFFLGMKHPVVFDPLPLDRTRRRLGTLALVIFLLSFTIDPFIAG